MTSKKGTRENTVTDKSGPAPNSTGTECGITRREFTTLAAGLSASAFAKYDKDRHLSGRRGFVEAFQGGALGPRPPAGQPAGAPAQLAPRKPALVMAEGDLVTIVWEQKRLDPNDKSKSYDAFTFDTFRVKDGKLAEHWDGAILDPPGQ